MRETFEKLSFVLLKIQTYGLFLLFQTYLNLLRVIFSLAECYEEIFL